MSLKLLTKLRNNWKKTVFFSCAAIYGTNYARLRLVANLLDLYMLLVTSCKPGLRFFRLEDRRLMQKFCKEAKKFGDVPMKRLVWSEPVYEETLKTSLNQ